MKRLNFYPYYEDILRSGEKTTTFRLTNGARFNEGDEVMISIGWNEKEAIDLHKARIEKLYFRHISELTDYDFEGESIDCKSPEATRLVLGCIYKTVLSLDDDICVIKFVHL
jgi:hypothetical protein